MSSDKSNKDAVKFLEQQLKRIGISWPKLWQGILDLFTTHSARHLDRSILLEETGSPLIMRRVLYINLVLFLAFLVWSINMKVNEVAVASGEIIPTGKLSKVQHLEGGIVSEIKVSEGELVKKDQVLIRLDTSASKSQMTEYKAKSVALKARIERLSAFISGNQLTDIKKEDLWRHDQLSILQQSVKSLSATRKVVNHQIKQLQQEIKELNVQRSTQQKQTVLIKSEFDRHLKEGKSGIEKLKKEKEALKEELDIREELVDRGYNSDIKFLSIQRQYFQIEKDIFENETLFKDKKFQLQMQHTDLESQLKKVPLTIEKKGQKIKELTNTLEEKRSRIFEQALLELDELKEELVQAEENLVRLVDVVDRSSIRSPLSGRVHLMSVRTLGAVIAPGEVIFEIVPEGVMLEAEVKITNKDIGHLRPGQDVQLKISTYDFARYGSIPGKLSRISPSTKLDNKGEADAFYIGKIALKQSFIGEEAQKKPLLPGMTLQAEIITGQKSVMEYILKPIYTSAQSALKER